MTRPVKTLPAGAGQHATAGPYSPVLEIRADRLVVISGQAPVDAAGTVIGDTIEAQTEVTLDNCLAQLRTAGCDFADVFKVNVYLRDLADWERFNAVYLATLPEPLPVRTAVQCGLLSDFLVEIEMWAGKRD
ncbi:MAG: RidA family protein [Azospirillaceae bacterium]